VLLREILNSITSAIYLTASTKTLVNTELFQSETAADIDEEARLDIRTGFQTIENQSPNLMHFKDRYRQLSRIPKPNL